MGKADSLAQGVEQGRRAILEGRAISQLRTLVETQNPEPSKGRARLETLLAD